MTAVDYGLVMDAAAVAARTALQGRAMPFDENDVAEVRSMVLERVWAHALDEKYDGPATVAGWAAWLWPNAKWAALDLVRGRARLFATPAVTAAARRWSCDADGPSEAGVALKLATEALPAADRELLAARAMGEHQTATGIRLGRSRWEVCRRQRELLEHLREAAA